MKALLLGAFFLNTMVVYAQNDTTIYGYVDPTLIETEVTPAFPGGPNIWKMYLEKKLQYPETAKMNGIEGSVIVEFTVGKDGKISEIKIFKSVNPELYKEAIRLIQKSMWVPALQGGKNVIYRKRQEIVFKL